MIEGFLRRPSRLFDQRWAVGAALGEILTRRNCTFLYGGLTEGLGSGVSITTYPVLSGVARFSPVTATELASEIGLDRTVTSRYATKLEESGLLWRRPDPQNPRKSLLGLTPAGDRVIALMRDRLAGVFDRQLRDWPEAEARAFVKGLERLSGSCAPSVR